MNIISTIKHFIKGGNIDSLNKQIAELENNLKRTEDDNARKIAEITSLKKKIVSLKAQNETLLETQKSLSKYNMSFKTEILSKDNKITKLQEEKDQLSETITKLQEKSSVIVRKNEDLKRTLKESDSINTKNISEIERLNREIENINEELEQERRKSKSTNKTIHELTILIEDKDSTIDDLKVQLTTESQANNSLKASINELQSLFDTIESQFNSLQKGYDTLYSELEELKTKTCTPVVDKKGDVHSKNNVLNPKVSQSDIAENEKEKGNVEELAKFTNETTINDSNIDDVVANDTNESVNLITTHENEIYDFNGSTQNNPKNNNIIGENSDTDFLNIENTNIRDKESTDEGLNSDTVVDVNATDNVLYDATSEHNNTPIESIADDSTKENSVLNTNNLIDNKDKETEDVSEPLEDISDDDDVLKDNKLPFVYDNRMIPAEKLSIPEVYDVKKEKIIKSKDFFSQNENELILWRRNLQEEYLMGQARFICPECKQPVKISGHKLFRGRVCYFAHFKDSDNCPYKTGTNRTKEEIERLKYSLVQESERHKRLKAVIASALQGEKSKAIGVKNVECEKRINSDIPYLKWRRPDVYAEYNGRKYVFELQLSTTFISVIVDRDIFYRLNDYNIIWIFNFEDNEEYVNLYNLMCKDIYYANKRNVFIFDADAEKKSKEKGELVLKCRWLDENGVWSPDEYVTIEMFQYDEEYHKPFIFDADKAYLEKYPEYAERRTQFENSREYLLTALMERQKHEEEIEKKRDEDRINLQSKLLNTDKSVERFRSGTKYGYQFEGKAILPAKYTSAESIGENGYAQVGFNRKIGLVRKDGKEIVPVEYKKIEVINNRHGVIMAQYKRIDLWLGDEYFTLRNEFDDKEQAIIKEDGDGKTNYILQTNTYRYSYSQSYYGNHPICRKIFDGYSKSTLFHYCGI